MRFSFFCGHCKELIREVVGSPMAFAGWQQHEACGYETYFDKFVWRENEKDKHPVALETRRFRDETAAEFIGRLPSAADLDAIAEEEKLKAANTDGQELLKDFESHKTNADDEAADAQKAVDEHVNPLAADSHVKGAE